MGANMTITKLKWKSGSLYYEAKYDNPHGEPDEHAVKCHDAPLPSFEESWAQLAQVIETEAELSPGVAKDITPVGLSVKKYDDGRWGAVVTGTRRLAKSNAPLVINTPHKPAEPCEGNSMDVMILDSDSVAIIEMVLREAERYIRGERAQQRLRLAS